MTPKTVTHIGTSGWNYNHWKGPFYPETLKAKDLLDYYVSKFHTVEINNTFYQLPPQKTFEQWRQSTPDEFLFAVKASRYITHMKKLKDPEAGLTKFLPRAETLQAKLGPILFQLPPRWRCNPGRLQAFMAHLPPDHRYTFEFRDPSWFDDEVYRLLADRNIAFCIYELAGENSPREVTADFVYIRLHGPGGAYQGSYDTRTLAGWAGAISSWHQQGREVFCYFDNDEKGYAAQNALQLQDMLG